VSAELATGILTTTMLKGKVAMLLLREAIWQAFHAVKGNVAEIIGEWFRELFLPCVATGLIAPAALAGYRNDAVYLRKSRYVQSRWKAIRHAMPALFDLLENCNPRLEGRASLCSFVPWRASLAHIYLNAGPRLAC